MKTYKFLAYFSLPILRLTPPLGLDKWLMPKTLAWSLQQWREVRSLYVYLWLKLRCTQIARLSFWGGGGINIVSHSHICTPTIPPPPPPQTQPSHTHTYCISDTVWSPPYWQRPHSRRQTGAITPLVSSSSAQRTGSRPSRYSICHWNRVKYVLTNHHVGGNFQLMKWNDTYTVKKSFLLFPSPVRMSLSKLYLGRKNLHVTS
jgi:hypothetical protein